MTTTAIPTLIVAVAALVLSACGSEAKPDEKQLVSEECHHAVKKELRDPDSARYGDEKYIAKVKLGPWSEQGKDPNIATVYGFVGSVNGRNGFGGMGEFQSYQCDVYFNKSGEIKTHIGYVDKLEFLDNYVGYLKDDAIETIVTKTVTPDGSPAS